MAGVGVFLAWCLVLIATRTGIGRSYALGLKLLAFIMLVPALVLGGSLAFKLYGMAMGQ
mgnify:CR=1 FL=1